MMEDLPEFRLTATWSWLRAMICGATLMMGSSLPVLAASGTWTPTGRLHVARDSHTATLLPNGTVVVAGGEGEGGATASTEVYNPTTKAWTISGPLHVPRAAHDAVLLKSGEVLVAGGCTGTCLRTETDTAELYHEATGKWSPTGSMRLARFGFGMVLLLNGKVLAVGGCTSQNVNGCITLTGAAEIYDPVTGKWTPTGSLRVGRSALTATLMPNGKVLVAGGINAAGDPIASAEVYNPATGSWASTGAMHAARDEHTALLLPSGKILVAGGENIFGVSTASAELYSPSTGTWSATGNLHTSRLEYPAVLLKNGNVLVSGGNNVTADTTSVLSSAEIYNPATGKWTPTGSMNATRVGHSSTLLSSGLVLNAAGANAVFELLSAETYQP
jgi:N-acetylneuraminic acid mutarotase